MTQPKVFVQLDKENIEAYTPKYGVDLIVPYLPKNKVIWAPFSRNEHHFADYLRQLGYKVINTHLDYGADFLTYQPDFKFDLIVDNPPFKNKAKYIEKTMQYNVPFALLLPFNCFGDNGIPNLFMKYQREPEMLIPDDRMRFLNQKDERPSFKTVYICNRLLPKQIMFTKLERNK